MNFKEFYLSEYYTGNIVQLKKYLTMSDEDKKTELIYQYWGLFDYFLENVLYWDSFESFANMEVEDAKVDYQDEIDQFGDWLLKKGIESDDFISPQEKPSWWYMRYVEDIKNQWLVHFSKNAFEIEKSKKFKYGVGDYRELGLTTYFNDGYKESGGYNFAYRIEDVRRYGRNKRHDYKYGGDRGVIFRASGVLVYHNGDEEYQVIFDGDTANSIVSFYFDNTSDKWRIDSLKSRNKVVEFDELEDLLIWFDKNYDQYRKHF